MGFCHHLTPEDVVFPSIATWASSFCAASIPASSLHSSWRSATASPAGATTSLHSGDLGLGVLGASSMLGATLAGRHPAARTPLQDARGEAGGGHLLRRGLDRPRRLPRGAQLRRHPQAAGGLRLREQPLRLLDAARAADAGRDGGRARRRLRHEGHAGQCAGPESRAGGGREGGRPRARTARARPSSSA